MGRFFRVIRALVGDPAMARLMTAFVAFVVAEYAVWIGMLVYAFGHGGATAAGLVAFAQLAPGIVLAPVLSALADRRSPTQLLAGGYVVQALGMAGVAVSLWTGGPPLVAYGLAVLASTAMTTTRPALFAVLPALARDARQLTAANVVAGWAENLGMVLSALVGALERIDAVPGQVLIRQGRDGDRFYAIADGEVAVSVDGRPRGVRGRGTGLGEIALLRRVPRTATVTAVGPATLFALDADTFLAAVSGHAPTRRHADQVASRWVTADTGPGEGNQARPLDAEP